MNKKLIVIMIAAVWGHAALLADGDGTPSLPCGREVVSRVNGGLRSNQTAAFQKEVDELSADGGGTLRIPAGEYVVSSLRIKSGVTLHLDNIRFENVKISVKDLDEARPPIVADDATYEVVP